MTVWREGGNCHGSLVGTLTALMQSLVLYAKKKNRTNTVVFECTYVLHINVNIIMALRMKTNNLLCQ